MSSPAQRVRSTPSGALQNASDGHRKFYEQHAPRVFGFRRMKAKAGRSAAARGPQ
jgi:hypothetical protein